MGWSYLDLREMERSVRETGIDLSIPIENSMWGVPARPFSASPSLFPEVLSFRLCLGVSDV